MRAVILAFAVAACATIPATRAPSAETVVVAERAFAARAGEVGWIPAFREYVAPDGELAQATGYANAPEQLAATEDDGNRNLFWWPAFAGISRSGDFGFTTGAVSFDEARTPRGHYFTVWRRQPDGLWKWIYDGGVGPIADPGALTPPGGAVMMLPTATRGEASADAAIATVRALETAGGAGRLAPQARVARTRAALAVGAAAGPENVSYSVSRIEASSGGDLVMVLGEAAWMAGGAPVTSLYARMWQRQEGGWRVVYDQLILPRPVPPPG